MKHHCQFFFFFFFFLIFQGNHHPQYHGAPFPQTRTYRRVAALGVICSVYGALCGSNYGTSFANNPRPRPTRPAPPIRIAIEPGPIRGAGLMSEARSVGKSFKSLSASMTYFSFCHWGLSVYQPPTSRLGKWRASSERLLGVQMRAT